MSVAHVYAKALFGTATDAALSLDKVNEQLGDFVTAIDQSKELQVALFSPLTNAKEKMGITKAIADKVSMEPALSRFLILLADKGRMNAIREIRDEFGAVRIASQGGLRGKLEAAEAIGDADVATLSQAFTKKLGRKVSFQVSTDPSLLAGVKVTVNGVTYDGTLKSQLERLRDRMLSIRS